MRISDWSSDVCSSDLLTRHLQAFANRCGLATRQRIPLMGLHVPHFGAAAIRGQRIETNAADAQHIHRTAVDIDALDTQRAAVVDFDLVSLEDAAEFLAGIDLRIAERLFEIVDPRLTFVDRTSPRL